MRVAILSDIHGNSIALDAVLADARDRGGVDAFWILGDLVALGPDPLGVLDRLFTLPHAHFTRGNTDRYVATGDRPPPHLADVRADPSLLPRLIEVAQTFTWTQGAIAGAGKLVWLKQLPLELRVTLPDGSRFLGVHASPGRDDGDGITAAIADDAAAQLLQAAEADMICTGHTHRPMHRRLGLRSLVNLGAVSLSATADKRASYVILTADSSGYTIEPRQVPFDLQRVVAQLEAADHPGRSFILKHLLP